MFEYTKPFTMGISVWWLLGTPTLPLGFLLFLLLLQKDLRAVENDDTCS